MASTLLWETIETTVSIAAQPNLASLTIARLWANPYMSSHQVALAEASARWRQHNMKTETPQRGGPRPGMSHAQKLLFSVTAWLICLMPFLFWWNIWFGRKLSD